MKTYDLRHLPNVSNLDGPTAAAEARLANVTEAQLQDVGAYIIEVDEHDAFSECREVMSVMRKAGKAPSAYGTAAGQADPVKVALFCSRNFADLFHDLLQEDA